MYKWIRTLGYFSLWAYILIPSPSYSQTPTPWPTVIPWPTAPAAMAMLAVADLKQKPDPKKLQGGSIAKPGDWKATFYAVLSGDGVHKRCTATLIGPQVLLAAAHCVADKGQVSITYGATAYSGRCTSSNPAYPSPPISADWLLCYMNFVVPTPWYETVTQDAAYAVVNQRLLLGGYGCEKVGGEASDKFLIGPTVIEQVPTSVGDPSYANFIVTRSSGGAAICEGDSGGAAYVQQPFNHNRRLVQSVNSHRGEDGTGISFLAALSTPTAKQFFKLWIESNKDAEICGINAAPSTPCL